jgi:hypothetical protein
VGWSLVSLVETTNCARGNQEWLEGKQYCRSALSIGPLAAVCASLYINILTENKDSFPGDYAVRCRPVAVFSSCSGSSSRSALADSPEIPKQQAVR